MRWTDAENIYLRREWGEVGARVLQNHLRRSWSGIYQQATRVLGLPAGPPQGHESINSASRRTGFSCAQIRTILEWAEVPVKQRRGGGRRAVVRHPNLKVEIDAVDAAIEAWISQTETIRSAADRHNLKRDTIWRWLASAGEIQIQPASRRHHRFLTAVVDRVVAARLPKSWASRPDLARCTAATSATRAA